MRHGVKEMMAVFMADKRRRKRLTAFVTALSLLVVAGVFLELMQPVVTMTPDPICGKTEHSHSPACYERVLACVLEEGEAHTHSDSCYKSVLVCGLSEHSHSDACYPTTIEESAIAVQPEALEEAQVNTAADVMADAADSAAEADVNTNANAEETQSYDAGSEAAMEETADIDAGAETAPNATMSNEATPEPDEADPEAPLKSEQPEGEEMPEEIALEIRNLSLVDPTGKSYLGQTLNWNYEVSGAETVTYVIAGTDGMTAASGTVDADMGVISWTADRTGNFVLTLTASNASEEVSAGSSFTVEEAAELSVSVSTGVRSCFAGDTVNFEIVKSGGAEPVACRITAEQSGEAITESDTYLETFTVTTVSASKVTTLRVKVELVDALGNTAVAECEIPCAIHNEETRSQWEKSARINATGIWMEDLLAVARTQLGYRESDEDFIVDEDGNTHGYTRYGDWYGAKYDEWCAAFASFCLHYAGVSESEFPQSANCEKWISRLNGRGLYASASQYEPETGDLIFFDWENDGEADHVGIVAKVSGNNVYSIEGNDGRSVRENSYALNDSRICGYGLVSLSYAQYVEDQQNGLADEAQDPAEDEDMLIAADALTGSADGEADAKVEGEELPGDEEDETEAAEADNFGILWAELEALVESEEYTEDDICAIGERADAAFETGNLSDAEYEELLLAIESLLYSAPATLAMDDSSSDEVIKASRYAVNDVYGWELSIKFIPVDDDGNVRGDVVAPSTTRYYFSYTDWSTGKTVKENCSAITNVLTSDEVVDVDLISMSTGAKYKDADYAKINSRSSSCSFYCGSSNAGVKAIYGTSYYYYMAVYYKPAEFTLTFADDEGNAVATATGVRGSTVSVPAIEGYAFNATNSEGKYLTGWRTSTGTEYGTAIVNVQSDLTLTPVWSDEALGKYTVTFDVNGTRTVVAAYAGQTFAELAAPDAEKDGYRFDGWFTENDTEYTSATAISADVILYARYTKLITISFIIDNPDYTRDPNSDYTHVTVSSTSGLNTDGFTYELVGTGSSYRVYGTGTLYSCTIPSGESLADNDLKLLSVSITNQVENGGTDNNACSYVSPYSWIDETGKVCSADTVFTDDTRLYLRLYANSEHYYLNYVCCGDCSNSVNFALSEAGVYYPNATLAVGNSVAAEYIPSAEDVNVYFGCANCGHGAGYGKVLDYWYILDQGGNQVIFTDGVTIRDTCLPSSGNTIAVYAAWKDAPQTLSVTFNDANGTTLSTDAEAACYSTFSDLKPANPTLDGCTFVGWTTDGGETLVLDSAVITTDTVFTAVYDATITVQIPNIANDDPTSYTESTFTVRTGKSLADALDENGDGITAETFINGYLFSGWLVSGDSVAITDMSSYSPVTRALTVTAQYTQACTITFCYTTDGGATYVTVATYYVKSNGSMYDAVDESGAAWSQTLPTPQVEGHAFNYWMDANGMKFSPSYYSTYTADTTYYANLTKLNRVEFYDGEELLCTAYVAENAALSTSVDADGNAFSMPAPARIGYVFSGWTDAEGNTVTESTNVSGDIRLSAQWEAMLRVHFVHSDPSVENAETVDTVYYVESGIALSAAVDENGEAIGERLPEAPEYTGYEFDGWYYKADDSSTAAKATLDMIITSETYLTANYTEIGGYTLTIHDMAPDGGEYSEAGVESVDFFLAAEDSARTVLEEHILHDGVNAADCIWYTLEGGEKKAFDIDSALTADMDIYTYTYCLKLNLNAETEEGAETASLGLLDLLFPSASAEVSVTASGNTITITAREGNIISASDFVIDGVDYALYTWTYTDDNGATQSLNLNALIDTPMAADLNVTATGTAPVDSYKMSVKYYVFVDGQRKLLETADTLVVKVNYRYYVSAGVLESVYGEFGFEASALTAGTRYFPYASRGQVRILADVAALDGYSPVSMWGHSSDVYYLPYQSVTYSGNYNDYITSNTFYTITVLDEEDNAINDLSPQYGLTGSETTVTLGEGEWKYWTGGSDEESAQTANVSNGVYTIAAADMTQQYTFKRASTTAYRITLVDDKNLVYTADEVTEFNAQHASYSVETAEKNVSVTLKSPGDNCTWTVERADGTDSVDGEYTITQNADGTVTITFAEIARNYVVRLTLNEDAYLVRYETEAVSTELAGSYGAGSQEWVSGNGPSTVAGKETPYIVTAAEGYTVLAPDTLVYTARADYGDKGDMLFTYSFWYWEVKDSNGSTLATLDAGHTLTAAEIEEYAVDGVVTLTARYSLKEDSTDSRYATCSFFVIINSRLADVGGGDDETPSGNYSDALYTTKVYGDQNTITLPGANGQLIYADAGSTTAVQVDASIRELDSTGYTYGGKTVYLENLPSDEYCLMRLRTWTERYSDASITIDGNRVEASDLTTENFTIRWFVFKYDGTDGWHVDGLLVPRQGKLTITKTFDGDAKAIETIKGGFSIDVSKNGQNASVYTLNLSAKTDGNATGYTAYDQNTDTYTWVIDVDQTQQYTVRENNYVVHESVSTTAEYRISNSQGATSGYVKYTDSGVEVTAYAYATDMDYSGYQTVHLRNTYIPTGTLMLRKIDATNGAVMANVSFTLYKGGELVSPIYKDGDDYYLYPPEDMTDMTEITDGTLTTNASGYLNLIYQDEEVTYTLKESVPTGYRAVDDIVLTIAADGNVTLTQNSAATLEGSILTVTNTSETTDITVNKVWAEGETPKEVKVRLMYNGTLISTGAAAAEVTLSADNNWTHTWKNQPLYLNGAPIEYTVRETWIGNSAWSADVQGDGFEDYVVTIGGVVYEFADDTTASTGSRTNADGTTEFASSASITVTNATYKGQIQFAKVDEAGAPLSGATFALYSDEKCEISVAEATSDANGQVYFGEFATGTYYVMKETESPEGYKENDTRYRVMVTSTGTRMEYLDGENWIDMTSSKTISNERIPTADLTVLKVDESNGALSGAEFQLQMQNSGGSWENLGEKQTTGNDGRITFEGLQPGAYRIVETKAPAGYYRLTSEIGFRVDDDGKVTLTNASDDWSLSGNGLTLTVVNHAGSELPMTGGRGTLLYTMGGLLLMAASLLCGLNQRRRRERRWTR